MKKNIIYVVIAIVVLVSIIIGYPYFSKLSQTSFEKNLNSNTAQSEPANSKQKADASTNTEGKFLNRADLKFLDAEGKPVDWSKYKDKYVVINFWAPWCHYCVQEMPDFMKLAKKYETDDKIAFMFVSVLGQGDSEEESISFMKDYKLPLFFDKNQEVFSGLGLQGIPDTIVSTPDNKLLELYSYQNKPYYIIQGLMSASRMEDMIQNIQKDYKK